MDEVYTYTGPYGTFTFSSPIVEEKIFPDRIEVVCEDGVWVLTKDELGRVHCNHTLKEEL